MSTPLILTIEDEPQMRKLLRVSLESNGYRWLDAATAKEGIALPGGDAQVAAPQAEGAGKSMGPG